ncbi:SDR family NAD(P)-dependent oxidoreductase [Microlunatus parietis]|uniref:NAD(P)-dependent dehydrogenase (Short-subunit alcohol dehydrogenase family) n=1 Tax=Microlunatus parietis TaxID=682979 RepID=A0A7Y9L9Q6_9ACTN|nr:glucose 1-dehydrogenase [Microlunatus parietis]NYE69842.1 NAD(P)-dependent dehydrogenase (short-subunit alcohol dehydrogenase family) [Microlunatus parietis]
MARFQNRVVIITGGGSGIGATMAELFAAEGASVIIFDREAAVADHPGGRVVDVTDRAAVREAVAEIEADLGRVDVLINNAAIAADTPFLEVTEEQWDAEVAVTLKGSFLCSQAVLPGMIARRSGSIVNIGSVNGVQYLGNEAYSAAKSGLLSLTRSLAVRYGPDGVRCNAILPGTIRTPIWDQRLAAEPDRLEKVARWYPLGRVGAPEDVARAALFLASDDAAWITGVALPVDGGLLAGNLPMTREVVSE